MKKTETGNRLFTEDTPILDRLFSLVCERLGNRRIGFLWQGEPIDPEPVSGFTWVHYVPKGGLSIPCRYALDGLKRPDLEGRTLDMLIIPAGSVPLLSELLSGLLTTKASMLVDGALRMGIPVLFETSMLREWSASADDWARESLKAAIAVLKGRGISFLGYTTALPEPREPVGSTVRLTERGWLSWPEIAPLIEGAETVMLAKGTKLTPEAMDRLIKLKIRVIEGAC